MFARRVAQVYAPGDIIIVHDYHLLLTPKLIRDQLHLALGISGHLASAAPSPAIGASLQAQQQRGMDWGIQGLMGAALKASGLGNDSNGPGAPIKGPATLGENLKATAATNGNGSSNGNGFFGHHHPHNEVMIGLFIHTPWPSSEIFRCLPSESEPRPSRERMWVCA